MKPSLIILGKVVWLLLLVVFSMALAGELKERIARPRPAMASEVEPHRSPYGMPSSHAVLYGLIAGLVGVRWPHYGVRGLAILLAFGLGMVRVLQGVHYPSDVLVGCLLGLVIGWAGWTLVTKVFAWHTRSDDSHVVP